LFLKLSHPYTSKLGLLKMERFIITKGVCHIVGLAIYIRKYLKAKEELLEKFKYFTTQKYIIFKKNPIKETKIPHDIITL